MQSPASSSSPLPHHSRHQPSVEDGGQSPGEPLSVELVFCLKVVHNLTQICLGGVVLFALIIANIPIIASLAAHIILCTVGYFILMAQAILAFSPFGWGTNLKYEIKRIIHLTMKIVGSVLAIIGSIIQMSNNNSNFNSSHGLCGFVAMLLAIVSLIGGLLTAVFQKQLNSKITKISHSCMGTVTLAVAFITILLAFQLYSSQILGDNNANLAVLLTVLALVGTLLMEIRRNVKRFLNR